MRKSTEGGQAPGAENRAARTNRHLARVAAAAAAALIAAHFLAAGLGQPQTTGPERTSGTAVRAVP